MKPFMDQHFLLETESAKKLYHNFAADQPIIDYHCHLPPADISENRNFENLTQIWLQGDHYKWRAMRAFGINEAYITGDAPDREKFLKWAETVPYTLRNPLYHWSHLELKNYFGFEGLLNPKTAESIYDSCSEKLQTPEFSVRSLLKRMKVEVACTTDDPADDLKHHKKIASESFDIKILPTFRPDKSYAFDKPEDYNRYLDRLADQSNTEIQTLSDLLDALRNRIDYFHQHGGRLSDHGLSNLPAYSLSEDEVNNAFSLIRKGNELSKDQESSLMYTILIELGRMYEEKGWVQQFHLGALRNTNDRMLRELGPDTGFDSIGDFPQAETLSNFLNHLDSTDQLAKTVLYNLNPADNELFAAMTGNYNDGSIKGKMQYGSAWWFLDQKDGMEKQINTLSNLGLLSTFVGMLTDSRSFLSFPRHEYFRRILCNLIGRDVENGELPHDMELLGSIVADVCYNNAKQYFNF